MALTVSETLSVGRAAKRRQIWSVGGGKGGIGKSLISASVGWQLARMGQRVVLVDADLGGANLHTCLGLPSPARTLADFIQRRLDTLEEALTVVDDSARRAPVMAPASSLVTDQQQAPGVLDQCAADEPLTHGPSLPGAPRLSRAR